MKTQPPEWLIFVLADKSTHGWIVPLRVFAFGVDNAAKKAAEKLDDGDHSLFIVDLDRDPSPGRHVDVTVNHKPVVEVRLV